jgi:hypothetical protein
MVFDGRKLKVRCTERNRDGHQCGNLIWSSQVACSVHRQAPIAGTRLSPDRGISVEQETI